MTNHCSFSCSKLTPYGLKNHNLVNLLGKSQGTVLLSVCWFFVFFFLPDQMGIVCCYDPNREMMIRIELNSKIHGFWKN